MSDKRKRRTRTTLKPDKEGICKALAMIANNSFPRGHSGAIRLTKMCFSAVKGSETFPLTNEQASKLLKSGSI